MTYPDAVADLQQYVALRRILLVHEASGDEDSCTRWEMFQTTDDAGTLDSVGGVVTRLLHQTFRKHRRV